MSFLLDTCCISELIKKKSNPGVIRWLESHDESFMYLSVLTLGELQKGVSLLDDSNRKDEILQWLNKDLNARFEDKIIPVDLEVSRYWGDIQANAKRNNYTIPAIDGLIAASALVHNLSIITRNESDFKPCGVKTINPWT